MIEINKKWAISCPDGMNIALYCKTKPKKKGIEPRWVVYGFYANLHNALHDLVNQEVADTHLASLKAVIAKLDGLYVLINRLPQITVSDIKST
jgi:hypothetical protein